MTENMRDELDEQPQLDRMRTDWNARAREDAYYYVAFARPRQTDDEFRSTADAVIPLLESELVRLPADGQGERRALEIGCGPGRLMIPMSRHFTEIHGVDVSDEMVRLAKRLLQNTPNARAHANNGKDLALFQSGFFHYAYSFLVFQHIPSKSVVLSYLGEIHRVLKPGGIFLGQFCGTEGGQPPDTWSGCAFTRDEIVGVASSHGFHVVAVSGEDTQYMLVTLRKPDEFRRGDDSAIFIVRAMAADGSATVPARGGRACVCLLLSGAAGVCDLASLLVSFNGIPAPGCYLSPAGPDGWRQLNVLLPKGVTAGNNRVTLMCGGRPVAESHIEITAPPRRDPKLIRLTDGVNLLSSMRLESRAVQATMEDIENPDRIELRIGGYRLEKLRHRCVSHVLDRYDYVAELPTQLSAGSYKLTIKVDDSTLQPDVEVEIV
ncbi:MAG TPA: methyltransferase domain-containing protein [Bryobacteraceae bacterium]|nr:methyltransferase domain-containing protein [Bryobacteraceae bacterium]